MRNKASNLKVLSSTYTWNYDNMLTDVAITGGNTSHYKYDGLGNRVSKRVNTSETRYIVDPLGAKVLAEMDVNNTITAYYVYGLGLISKITPSGQTYYYHYDGLGSTIAITDSSGVIRNKYAYDAYGKILNQVEDPLVPNSFKYVGKYGVMDDGNGLLYMRARYYDPEVGRFINKDPIGWAGGVNMYAYAENNPNNFIDPAGLTSSCAALAALNFISCFGLINWYIELAIGPAIAGCSLMGPLWWECFAGLELVILGATEPIIIYSCAAEAYKKYLSCASRKQTN